MANLPKGFRDFTPQEQIKRERIIDTIKKVFRKWGFDPIETPSVEFYETLIGKYGEEEEKLIYHFEDFGGRKLGLRYDLTVPLSRFVKDHQVIKPFKRYQIQPVWRAEKPQKGRFREFYQCDIDIVGSKNPLSDALIIATINDALKEIKLDGWNIKINHRSFIKSLCEKFNIENEVSFLRAIDKIDKIGYEGLKDELTSRGFKADEIIDFFKMELDIESLMKIFDNKLSIIGYNELKTIFHYLDRFEVKYKFDISLVRGLDYYTGMVFEIELNNIKIGSISGGGRYDKLMDFPAVGGSIGIDRIISALEEINPGDELKTYTDIIISYVGDDKAILDYSINVFKKLKNINLNIDLYCGDKDLRGQIGYANDKGIKYIIIIGDNEVHKQSVTVKDLETGYQREVGLNELEKLFNT
jgi:histidyl-tRNA synthetase